MTVQDVPSPIDFCDPRDARAWERTAQARPGRSDMFQVFGQELAVMGTRDLRVLDLGSGPGFLAEYLIDAIPAVRLTLLDMSAPMHRLAADRLGSRAARVAFVERSFKDEGWADGLGPFDAVITNQAVHELRHKRYATRLHSAVKGLLAPAGMYLVCDHFCGEGGFSNDQLYMTIEEQGTALREAGFPDVQPIARAGTMVMHRALGGHRDRVSSS